MEPSLQPLPHDQELLAQRGFLRRLARGLLGHHDHDLAEDIVQEAELRALERGPEAPGSLGAWLSTVTRRLALNARRARERRTHHEHLAARGESIPGADEALEGLELQRGVLEAVRALDEPYRSVVWQRYYEDRAPGEIAARLGLPLPTVKTRLRRALQRLREGLDERHEGRREAWAAGLLPLAGRSAPIAAGSPAALTLGGGLLMKKLLVGLALVLLVWLGWRAVRGEPERVAPSSPATNSVEVVAVPEASPQAALPLAAPVRAPLASAAAAPVERAVPATATLVVHATWEHDGSDASGVGLTLWPAEDSLAELNARFAETGADGRVRFEAIPPGAFVLHTDRVLQSTLKLHAGEKRELALTLPDGLDVAGVVIDGAGQPVARAEVWLEGQEQGSLGGRIVARTGADGTFRLRALGEEQSLGAFAPGFAPAFLEHVRGKTPAPGTNEARVTLVLDRTGHELHGRVLGPDGRPLSGARVALGTAGNMVSGGRNGREGWRPRARSFTTAEDGEFRAWIEVGERKGLGGVLVHALAPGFAQAKVEEHELGVPVHEIVVRFEVGASIEGSVRTRGGEPVGGALVAIRSAGTIQRESSPFGLPETRTRADGTYRIEHVPSGAVELVVSLESDPRSGAEEARTLADGSHELWDLTLGAARVITGHVVNEEGAGLAEQSVLVSDGRRNSVVTTDAKGEFLFTPSGSSEEWDLTLMGAGGALDLREKVRLGTEVVLVARAHRAAIHGGFTDRAGLALESESILARLWPESDDMFFEATLDAQGAFVFEGLAPGTYRVTIECGGLTLAESAHFEVRENQAFELAWLESGVAPEPR
jgi:RNA polymerase sigma-70 factor (ECF subfamily)